MKRNLMFILTLLLCVQLFEAKSQDYHLTQFNETPLLINPAQTGAFNGDQRVITYYRNQWSSIVNPYQTYGVSIDARLIKTKSRNGYLSAGMSILKDKAGKSEMSHVQSMFSLAYHQKIAQGSVLTGGVQGGFTQWTLNTYSLNWHNQYDPNQQNFDQSLPTGESSVYQGYTESDISAGLLYSYSSNETNMSSNDGFRFQMGAAAYHVNRSKKTFSNVLDFKSYTRFTLHAKSSIGLSNTNVALLPMFIYQKQGPNQEIVGGFGFRFMLQESSRYTGFVKESAFTLGSYIRYGDAIIPYIAFEYANYSLGVSYDVNVSGLRRCTKSFGGVEINLRYINPNPFTPRSRSFY